MFVSPTARVGLFDSLRLLLRLLVFLCFPPSSAACVVRTSKHVFLFDRSRLTSWLVPSTARVVFVASTACIFVFFLLLRPLVCRTSEEYRVNPSSARVAFVASTSCLFDSLSVIRGSNSSHARGGRTGRRRRRRRRWGLRDGYCRGGAGRRGSEGAGVLPRAARSETAGALLAESRGLPPDHRPPPDAVEALLPGEDAFDAHVAPSGGHPAGHGAAAQAREIYSCDQSYHTNYTKYILNEVYIIYEVCEENIIHEVYIMNEVHTIYEGYILHEGHEVCTIYIYFFSRKHLLRSSI